MIDWDAEVRRIADAYPLGISMVVQFCGPVPTPPEGMPDDEKQETLDLLERTAHRAQSLMS